MIKLTVAVLIFFSMFSCSSVVEKLDGVDSKKFKLDVGSCRGYRASVLDTIVSQRSKLYQMREVNLKKILGRPDKMDLNQRSTKVFFYKTSLNQDCKTDHNYSILAIELDALGRVSLVYILPN